MQICEAFANGSLASDTTASYVDEPVANMQLQLKYKGNIHIAHFLNKSIQNSLLM